MSPAQDRVELLTPLKERAATDSHRILAPFRADSGYRDAIPADAPAGRGDEPRR
jgi:hypothetical protein